MDKDTNLIWIDLEMTGLLPEKDVIIEIATIVTDKDLNVWNTEHHGNSGLVQRVKDSDISAKQAEIQTLDFLQKYVNPGVSPMCGNSICQDRRFLYNYMPTLEQFFHYRHIDVTTLTELVVRWKPEVKMVREGESAHLALSDTHDSIKQLKHYRDVFIDV
jgi:oligoribonuclease